MLQEIKFAIARHVKSQSTNQQGAVWAVVCNTSQNNINIWKTGCTVSPCKSAVPSRKSCQEGTSVGEVSDQSNCKKVWHLLRKQDGPARSQGSQRGTGLLDLNALNGKSWKKLEMEMESWKKNEQLGRPIGLESRVISRRNNQSL